MSVVLFGSVARAEPTPFSDIDLLLVFKKLPAGRRERFTYLGDHPQRIEAELDLLHDEEVYSDIMPHIKTTSELVLRTPFLFEVCKDGIPLFDPLQFFGETKQKVIKRAEELGTRWCTQGRFRYLDLKPDFKPGEVFEL